MTNTYPKRSYKNVEDLEKSVQKEEIFLMINTLRKIYERDIKIREKQKLKKQVMNQLLEENEDFKQALAERMKEAN